MLLLRTFVLASLCAAAGCAERRRAAVPAPRPTLRAADVTVARPADDRFLGLVIAPETVDLTSQLEARLEKILVRPGDHVERNAVVALLDTRTALEQVQIARAELESARSDCERAKLGLLQAQERLARRQQVVQLPTQTVGTVSDEELSAARYQEQLARVQVAASEAALTSKTAHMHELSILAAEGAVRAPFAGTVAARYADAGSLIRKGSAIVRIIESGELKVRFAVPEERANSVAVGDAVEIAAGGDTLDGTVETVAPEIDAAARVVFAEASLDVTPAAAARIRSGEVASVWLATNRAASARR